MMMHLLVIIVEGGVVGGGGELLLLGRDGRGVEDRLHVERVRRRSLCHVRDACDGCDVIYSLCHVRDACDGRDVNVFMLWYMSLCFRHQTHPPRTHWRGGSSHRRGGLGRLNTLEWCAGEGCVYVGV